LSQFTAFIDTLETLDAWDIRASASLLLLGRRKKKSLVWLGSGMPE